MIFLFQTKNSINKKRTRLIVSLLTCSIVVLGSATITTVFIIKSCNNNKNNIDTTRSYYTLSTAPTNPIYFEASSTSINTFCADSAGEYNNNNITINGKDVGINDIYSLNFGVDYSNV